MQIYNIVPFLALLLTTTTPTDAAHKPAVAADLDTRTHGTTPSNSSPGYDLAPHRILCSPCVDFVDACIGTSFPCTTLTISTSKFPESDYGRIEKEVM